MMKRQKVPPFECNFIWFNQFFNDWTIRFVPMILKVWDASVWFIIWVNNKRNKANNPWPRGINVHSVQNTLNKVKKSKITFCLLNCHYSILISSALSALKIHFFLFFFINICIYNWTVIFECSWRSKSAQRHHNY